MVHQSVSYLVAFVFVMDFSNCYAKNQKKNQKKLTHYFIKRTHMIHQVSLDFIAKSFSKVLTQPSGFAVQHT